MRCSVLFAALSLPSVGLLACAPEPVLLDDDQLALAVVLEEEGALAFSTWVEAGSGAELVVDAGQSLFVFPMERDAFAFRGDGAWLSQRPRVALDDGALCTVCLLPQTGLPQAVLPGESCPLPQDVMGSVHAFDGGDESDVERLAALRSRLRLVWGEPLCPRVGRMGTDNGAYGALYDGWLASNGAPLRRIFDSQAAGEVALDADFLSDFDLLLVEWPVRAFTSTESRALATWVQEGGGLIVTSGFERGGSEPERVNSLLAALDASYEDPRRNGPIGTFEAHPVTRDVRFLDFQGGYGVRAPGLALARTVEGPVSAAFERGAGRVVLWGDEWVLANFSFEGTDDSRTFWSNAIAWTGR